MTNVNVQEVTVEIAACRKELFNLKLSQKAGQVKDISQFKKLRKKIARLLTQVNAIEGARAKSEHA